MFYETDDGKLINLALVRCIEVDNSSPVKHGVRWVDFHFGDDRPISAQIQVCDLNDGMLTRSAPIAAQAGFFRLDWYGSDTLLRHPIIAWEKDQFGNMLPICVEPSAGPRATAVEQSDGRVIDIHNEVECDSAGEWLADRIRNWKEPDERKKAA